MKRRAVVEIISFLLIVLFIYAASSKLLDYQKFRVQIGQSPLLTAFAGWVAWIIPSLEILIAILLAIPRWRLPALYASLSLMTMFTAYIVTILKFSEFIPCSCGGILQKMTWNQHLVFNICFVIISATGIVLQSVTPQSPKAEAPGSAASKKLLQQFRPAQ